MSQDHTHDAAPAPPDVDGDRPIPLPPELAPVPPFPVEAMPAAFRGWVADVAERMQCPPDFVGVPMLTAAASLAARSVCIRLRRHDDWTERGNLWAAIVGRPGVMKSPAMSLALAPIDRLEAQAGDSFTEAVAQHRAEALAARLRADTLAAAARKKLKDDPAADVGALLRATEDIPGPKRARYVVNAPTWEKLHAILAENEGGVLMVRDELGAWLRDMGREENAEARGGILQAWSGGTHTLDRIGRGVVVAKDMKLSIVGGVQPGPLARFVRQSRRGTGDDGLLERFVIAWPDDPGAWRDIDRAPDTAARGVAHRAFERLAVTSAWSAQAAQPVGPDGQPDGMPYVGLSDAAADIFDDWRAHLERRLRAGPGDPTEAARAKFRHHVPALALTLHLVDGGAGPVAGETMSRTVVLADYFEAHTRRLYASGTHGAVRGALVILAKLRSGALGPSFTVRDAWRPQWAGLSDSEAATDAVDLLLAHRYLNEASMSTGGRPTSVYYLTEAAQRALCF